MVNIIHWFSYWHVDGVVEAGVFIPQYSSGSNIFSFPVILIEGASNDLSRWIHTERVRDVNRPCKGIQKG